jgi:hypothetical protein
MKHKKCGETKSSAFSSGNDQLSPEAQKPRELVIRRQPRSPALSRDTTTLLPDHRIIFPKSTYLSRSVRQRRGCADSVFWGLAGSLKFLVGISFAAGAGE